MVGANVFIQNTYVEVGIAQNGSFGAGATPNGYHACPNGGAAHPTANTNLAQVCDWQRNGWTVGAPVYGGDYVYPGTPFEGWSMEVNGARSDNYFTTSTGTCFTNGTCTWNQTPGVSALSGNNISYSNVGGIITGVWQGTTTGSSGGLTVTQSTRVDANALWTVITTTFKNNTGAAIPGVYYFRSADPDDDVTTSGSYVTKNTIVYQNDVDHRVLVNSTGLTTTGDYLALATKDCRAKVLIYTNWASTPGQVANNSLANVYNQATGTMSMCQCWYGVGNTTSQDIAFGIVFNIGTIQPGATATISYAYLYGSDADIDNAFPEPALIVNGVTIPPTGPAPAPTIDTFRACNSGITNLNVSIANATDKDWTGSAWSWSPSTGLASTTGVTNVINITSLPPVITYTITGNDSNINMQDCAHRIMYLTILTCNGATVNYPCQGDSLFFNAPGDSTGATYVWVGPNSWTNTVATTQSFTVTPAVWADTGTYHVIKTVGTVHDTASIHALISPLPTLSPASSLCPGGTETLSATPPGGTWSSSNTLVATIGATTGLVTAGNVIGTTTMTYTTLAGCKSTTPVTVVTLSPISGVLTMCQGKTTTLSNTAAGGTWTSVNTAVATIGLTSGVVTGVTAGTSVITYMIAGGCLATTTVTVFAAAQANGIVSTDLGCGPNSNVVTIFNSSNNGATYVWNWGDGSPNTTTLDGVHGYTRGTFTAVLTTTSADGCVDTHSFSIDTRHDLTAAFTSSNDTMCLLGAPTSTTLTDGTTTTVFGVAGAGQITTYSWDFGDGTAPVVETGTFPPTVPAQPSHTYSNQGAYQIVLTSTDSIGCISTYSETVVVYKVNINSWHDTTLCLRQPMLMVNTNGIDPQAPAGTYYTSYAWTESPKPNLSDITIQSPTLSGFGTFTDILQVNDVGTNWNCYALDTMVINSVLGRLLTNVTSNEIIPYGSTVQLNADNEVFYHWIPNDGSIDNPNINNPIAEPLVTTTYTVWGMDQYGCVDSAYVTITVDSSLHEFIPSAFTPNGDGLNDAFRPLGLSYQKLVEFRVFNRWGQQVFYSNNIKNGWDGTFNGVPQDAGVYNYIVIVSRPGSENHEGTNVVYKGDVTLLR
jgi:gliding motility-associated-like protein